MSEQPDTTDEEEPSLFRRACLRWPLSLAAVWIVLPVAGLFVRVALEPVAPHDYWWHLAMGRVLDATGEVPASNLFLYTLPADQPFHDQPWLAQWVMYRCFAAFGHTGAIVLRNVLLAATWLWLLVVALDRCDDPRFAGGYLLVIGAITGAIFAVRTQMFVFLPYVLLVAGLLRTADGALARAWLWGLVPLTALWANLHGTFVLVPVLTGLTGGALLLEELLEQGTLDRTRLLWWSGLTAVTAAAGCLTPSGPAVYAYVWELTFQSNLSATVAEWRPPDVSDPFGAIAVASILGSAVVLAVRRRSVHLYEAVLFGATAYLGLDAIRSLFWWGAAAALIVPRYLRDWIDPAPWYDSETSPVAGVGHALVVGSLVVGAVLAQPGWPVFEAASARFEGYARRSGEGARLLTYQNATELVERLAREGYPGRLFHAQAVGGLVDYKIGAADPDEPRRAAFLDQRMSLVPESVWNDYFTVSRAADGWASILERHDVGTLLLNTSEQQRLVREAQASPEWRLEAVGEAHLLFVRSDRDTIE